MATLLFKAKLTFSLFLLSFVYLALLPPPPTSAVMVNCRCGAKPWTVKDLSASTPTRHCCEYFIESGEGNFTSTSSLCQIENEFIYKRFHSCCVSLIRNAYCFQQKLATPPAANEEPWARYQKLFASSPLWG